MRCDAARRGVVSVDTHVFRSRLVHDQITISGDRHSTTLTLITIYYRDSISRLITIYDHDYSRLLSTDGQSKGKDATWFRVR